MTTLNDVAKYIRDAKTHDDLNEIARMLKNKHDMLKRCAGYALRSGLKVEFTNSRTGEIVKGTITKVNQKTVNLTAFDGTKWKVTTTLIRARD